MSPHPGALPSDTPGPTDPLSVTRLNELYMLQEQAVSDRLEAEGRGWDGVFAG